MTWIIASFLMLISSVALYLCVRKSNLLQTPAELNNLAMFLFPVIAYLFLSLPTGISFNLKPFEHFLLIFQALFFSYLGNLFSLRGIEKSPNPGYSLIISKSYVIFTSVASIFIFNAPLTFKSVVAIALIIGFSALILIDKTKDKENSDRSWIWYTLGAFFCWGFLALSSKYLLNAGVPILTRLIYSMGIVSAIILGEVVVKKVAISNVSRLQLLVLLAIGLFGTSFNYFMQVGFNLAPNVGFINATNAGSISLLTVCSALIFKDELNVRKMIGVVGVTVGLCVLFL